MKKKCKKCGINKLLQEFYKHKCMKDGHINICASCFHKSYPNKKVENPMPYPRHRKYHPELIKKALKMHSEGFSHAVIHAELGVPPCTVDNYLYGRASIETLDRGYYIHKKVL